MNLNFNVFQFVKSPYSFNLAILFSFKFIKLCKDSKNTTYLIFGYYNFKRQQFFNFKFLI